MRCELRTLALSMMGQNVEIRTRGTGLDTFEVAEVREASITVGATFRGSRFFMSCSDRAKIASFCTFLMKLGF